jgi:signal transduction histidine kinase
LGASLIGATILIIFIIDTITELEIAIAVLYVVVILLSVGLLSIRGILLVSVVCALATVVSFVLTRWGDYQAGLINCGISLLANAATTYLSVVIQKTIASERQARRALAETARAASLGELGATIAHEINQPLGAIGANGGATRRWLSADPPNLDRAREAVAAIVVDASRAAEIVLRIRSLAGGQPTKREMLDLNRLVEDAAVLMREELQRQRITLKVELAEDLPAVSGDQLQLQQVLLNLLANAAEAISEGRAAVREIFVRTSRPDADYVVVAVQDTGIGIDAAKSTVIFDAFYSTKAGGMGLGLAICRTLIKANSGRIWSEPSGRGATFKFALPIERRQPNATPQLKRS